MSEDPFPVDLFGGLPKMVTSAFANFTGAITVHENPSAPAISSSGRAIKSSSERRTVTLRSVGDTRDIDATAKRASNAIYSETRARTYRRSLSDRLTLSLISSGLVKGITPSSTRKQFGQPIQVLALDTPVGGGAGSQKLASSSLSASPTLKQLAGE